MTPAGLSSFISSVSVVAAFAPVGRAIRRATRPFRFSPAGRVYLGEGQPVLVLPAFGHGAESTTDLRATLLDARFAAYDWGLGTDRGPARNSFAECLRRVEEQLIDVFEKERAPVTLIGWGLSGIYAREVAKRASPLARQVITLGTPFRIPGVPNHCEMLKALDPSGRRLDAHVRHRLRQSPPVPCTSIYSPHDGQVPWELCVERETAESENVVVRHAAHAELATHPRSLEVITHRLAQPMDEWRPFDA